ncbi:DMT family transporter [Actibacterium pelagium]|uniref:RhaT family transporter n=1 Tax=Actibacterium pelagium TaxID=2029103 RepID=A0A917EIQ0_9RHOB|nr:DMT family transporter [Actibacterium pelagium]GGE49653.1 RhaT family transporter [Actibacterium pelagium]
MTEQNTRLGIYLMALTMLIFALQDAISQHLARHYNVYMIVMIRYWFFAAFVIAFAARQAGGLRKVAATKRPFLQIFRAALIACEICVMITSFVHLGLIESHAVFAAYPLLVAALSGPVLGEKVGWRRWSAIGVGFIGVLVILQPGMTVFSPFAIIPLIAALMFALYGLLNRYAARFDGTATSFFWTGVVGAILLTPIGLWHWEAMTPTDWGWMLALCITGATAHWLLIRCYELTEASALQPFAYLQLVFATILGLLIFGEVLRLNVAIGAGIVISAGMFTLIRARRREKAA